VPFPCVGILYTSVTPGGSGDGSDKPLITPESAALFENGDLGSTVEILYTLDAPVTRQPDIYYW
jgi:hypothetical protein